MDHPQLAAHLQFADQTFVALPSDPGVPLTHEQLLAVFGGADRLNAERDLLRWLAERRGGGNDGLNTPSQSHHT